MVDMDMDALPPLPPGAIAVTEAVALGKAVASLARVVTVTLRDDALLLVDDDGDSVTIPLGRIARVRIGVFFPEGWLARVGGLLGWRPSFRLRLDDRSEVHLSTNRYAEDFPLFLHAFGEFLLRDWPGIGLETGGGAVSSVLAAIICAPLALGSVFLAVNSLFGGNPSLIFPAVLALFVFGFMGWEAVRRFPRRAATLAAIDRAIGR